MTFYWLFIISIQSDTLLKIFSFMSFCFYHLILIEFIKYLYSIMNFLQQFKERVTENK